MKALVIGMAVLIVVGFAVVVATIAQRLSGFAREEGAPIGDIALPVAEACSLADVSQLDGDLVAVRLDGPRWEGCASILLIDLEAGKVVGRLQADENAGDPPTDE